MAFLGRLFSSGNLHPRENIQGSSTLSTLNGSLVIDCDGSSSAILSVAGTFSATFVLEGTVDLANWFAIPIKPLNTSGANGFVASTTTAGTWKASCAGYRQVRVRCSAYTSGSGSVFLMSSVAPFDDATKDGSSTSSAATILGTAGAATTLTLASPGAGLRHYITYLSINRIAAAVLTAAATPVAVTTTNLPGSLAFSFPSDAAALGTIDRWREDFAYPIASSAQNTATTIVAPLTANVQWRITAGFYVAP